MKTPEGFTLGENQTRYDSSGNPIAGAGVNAGQSNPQALAQTQSNIEQLNNLFGKLDSSMAVGPSAISRWSLTNPINNSKGNFIAEVEQITGQLTLDNLIRAKGQGATFGALSEGELRLLQSSASKINSWAVKKDGKVVGYKANKKDFKAELDKIGNFAKLDYVLKGGSPEDVGATQMPDGSIWSSNSDGTKTQLLDKSPFNQAGNASASNQVKGMSQRMAPLPLLNVDGNPKTPNLPLAKAYPPDSVGGQCGVWVRSVVEKTGLSYPRVGNSLAEKTVVAKRYGVPITQAKPGSVLLTNENKDTGHVAYIIGANKQGFVVAESNYGLNEKVSYGRVIPFNSSKILGVINPQKA